jgi:hypothetical protein
MAQGRAPPDEFDAWRSKARGGDLSGVFRKIRGR